MQVRDTSRSLLAGDPQCAPSYVALGQAIVDVIRALHQDATWTPLINDTIKVDIHPRRNSTRNSIS